MDSRTNLYYHQWWWQWKQLPFDYLKDIDNSLIDIQLLASGELPVPPTVVPSEVEKKLSSHWTLAWDTPVVAATEAKTYTATWVNDYGTVVDDFSGNLSGNNVTLKLYDTGIMVMSKSESQSGEAGTIISLGSSVVNTLLPNYDAGLPSYLHGGDSVSVWEVRDQLRNEPGAESYATSLVVEKGVKTIPALFCKGCESITSLEIYNDDNEPVTIKTSAFAGCSSLQNVSIKGNIVFQNSKYNKAPTTLGAQFAYSGINSASAQTILNKVVPSSDSSGGIFLPLHLFESCLNIVELDIPSTISGLQYYEETNPMYGTIVSTTGKCFYNCSSLSRISFNGMFFIDYTQGTPIDHFAGCTSLSEASGALTRIYNGSGKYTETMLNSLFRDTQLNY